MVHRICVMPGDGIGPEVTRVAVDVLQAVAERAGLLLQIAEADLGGVAIERWGAPLPAATIEQARGADAILVGAVGGPRWDAFPFDANPGGGGLLRLRHELDLYANLRPVETLLSDGRRVDLLLVREGTGGLYFGDRGSSGSGDGRHAFDTMEYTARQVRRILERACDLARRRRREVVSVDKANVLASSRLWRDVAEEVFAENPDVSASHMHVDNCAAQLVIAPEEFDVIVTENLFGDILSDQAAAFEGSLGLAASASLGSGGAGLYEPVHGSAPDIAGLGIANPTAAIRSVALLLHHSLNRPDLARQVSAALTLALNTGAATADVQATGAPTLSTEEFGDRVLDALDAVIQTNTTKPREIERS